MNEDHIDVVIVPDFSGSKRLVFELRTLFFLASWLAADTDAARLPGTFRPHVCCIGGPPSSVRRLASRIGAGISVHAPLLLDYGGFANKLRGLEAPLSGRRILLLDADVFVLGALDGLLEIDADLAAVPAGKPQVPESQWRLIYEALGLPLPTERILSIYGRPGIRLDQVAHRYEEQEAEAGAMLPYYNTGAVLVRADAGLRSVWEGHLKKIPAVFAQSGAPAPAHAVTGHDQVGFATAVQWLRREGRSFATLPDAFNARLVHFRTRTLRVGGTRLLHAAGFASFVQKREEARFAVENYEWRWLETINEGWRDDPQERAFEAEKARSWLWMLWDRWVREAWDLDA